MRYRSLAIPAFASLLSILMVHACGPSSPSVAQSDLIIVLDGLRPDYVTPELMPNLHRLGQRGVVFANHHSVFPTVTRVNAASIATGTYPRTHGLMGNTVYFPEVDAGRGISTSERENLLTIEDVTGGRLLTATSLGEVLGEGNRRLMVISSGSSGAAALLDHTLAGAGIVNNDFTLPESLNRRVHDVLGEVPPDSSPNAARNRRVVDAYIRFALDEIHPDVTIMWLSDPDHTAHAYGIGAPETVEALRLVDGEIGRIEAALIKRGLLERVNIFVASDHGFSTYTGGPDLARLLDPFDGIVEVDGAVYGWALDSAMVRQIVERLQRAEGIGPIFTAAARSGDVEGSVAGTLSLELIRWDHPRAAQIMVAPSWTGAANEHGYPGTSGRSSGAAAGHGGIGPFDVHNTLIAAGPDIRQGLESDLPTSNADLAPTILYLLGLEAPESMEGRVMVEALSDRPGGAALRLERSQIRTQATGPGGYGLIAHLSRVDGHRYVDYVEVTLERGSRD